MSLVPLRAAAGATTREDAADDVRAVTAVLRALASAGDVADAARVTLDAIREAYGWTYGSYRHLDQTGEGPGSVVESGDPAGAVAGGTRAVCFPIKRHGEVVGTMGFATTDSLALTERRQRALGAVRTLFSQAIERLAVMSAVREERIDAAAALGVLVRTLAAGTIEGAARGAIEAVCAAYGWTYGSFWRVDPAEKLLRLVIQTGGPAPKDGDTPLGQGVDLAGRAWRDGDLVYAPDLAEPAETGECRRATAALAAGAASGLYLPVRVHGEVVGVIEFLSTDPARLGAARLAAQREIARLASMVMRRLADATRSATVASELAASTRRIAGMVSRAAHVADGALAQTSAARKALDALGASGEEIDGVVKIISSAAEQTNVLAVNATIEAARAGKGLIVVADEVKELAQETGEATSDVEHRIRAIQDGSDEAVAGISAIAEAVAQLNRVNALIAEIVAEQHSITDEFLDRGRIQV